MPRLVAALVAWAASTVAPDLALARVTHVTDIAIFSPSGLAVDSAGNLYVASFFSDSVSRIAPDLTTTTILTLGGDGHGNFLVTPDTLLVDEADNLYVAGRDSDNVFRSSPGGAIVALIDDGGDGLGHALDEPADLAVTPDGTLYVSGSLSDNVFAVTPDGTVTLVLDATGDGMGAMLDDPRGVAVDGAGNVYVASNATDTVFRIAPGGAVDVIMDATGDGAGTALSGPADLAVDAAGNLYVGSNDVVFRRAPDGTVTAIAVRSATPLFTLAGDLVVDAGGTVYVAGFDGVAQIRPDGRVRIVLDPTGDGEEHGLDYVRGIALDRTGGVFAVTTALTSPSSDDIFHLDFPCGLAPASGCRAPTVDLKSSLVLRDKTPDRGDTLVWKWIKGEATAPADFGDPTTTTDYTLCTWDESGGTPSLTMEANARAGGTCAGNPCWKAKGTKGFGYRDTRATPDVPKGTPDGMDNVVLKSGAAGKAKIVVKGKGEELVLPPLPLALPHRVQLVAGTGACWEATYAGAGVKVNDAGGFIGKAGMP